MNFKDLDDLISRGVKEIVLDSDVVLDDDEKSEYGSGIKLDVDDLIIDGDLPLMLKEKQEFFLSPEKILRLGALP